MSNDEGIPNGESSDAQEIAFWEGESAVVREEPEGARKYDLEERTARFGEAVIMVVRAVPDLKPAARDLWRELHLIFCKICRSR